MIELGELLGLAADAAGELGVGAAKLLERALFFDQGGAQCFAQAQHFTKAINVTGIFLAKLDGTAKGGIVLAIQSELGIPVKVVGIGETADDLVPFDPEEFVAALF